MAEKKMGCWFAIAIVSAVLMAPCLVLALGWIALAAEGILRQQNTEAGTSVQGDDDDELQQRTTAAGDARGG